MGYIMQPRFQLAFRRTIFYLILLVVYLLLGSLVFCFLWKRGSILGSIGYQTERLDFERSELLNVLYAEAIARPEHDWALLANQKLDAYERGLADRIESGQVQTGRRQALSFGHAFRHCFSLVTTIGPVDIDDLNRETKLFSILYAVLGIPLVLVYLGQCARAISSLFPGVRNLLLAMAGTCFLVAVIYDVAEQGSDDTPFIDALSAVFLTMSTIGCEDDKDELPSVLLYLAAVVGISAFSVTFSSLQQELERLLGPYELQFTHQYAHLERALSGNCLEVLEEEEDHSEDT